MGIENMQSFAPNGVVTKEECPECGEEATVEHGREYRGERDMGPMHFWHCPECGDSLVTVCYDCEHCQRKTPCREFCRKEVNDETDVG